MAGGSRVWVGRSSTTTYHLLLLQLHELQHTTFDANLRHQRAIRVAEACARFKNIGLRGTTQDEMQHRN